MPTSAVSVVVDQELAADREKVAEEVDQRLALHSRIMMAHGLRLRASAACGFQLLDFVGLAEARSQKPEA
jgi:hypothetical protein